MGGAVSAGADNDELIDNLLEADYIKSPSVEKVFRAVDRGHYFTVEYKDRAYRDLAWKCGNLHISAPCIYSEVMENLQLGPGMSFLNLGSGTGYLSTMAGLILGSYGINHGIEIHEDVLEYATNRLEEFILTSTAIDEYEFCQPKFVYGNCLYLGSGHRQYDRVYCGAACPENHENYMKNLIKVGGILVMPINDQLLQISRTSDTNWETKPVLPVSFATLISGKVPDCNEPLSMPDSDPLSLQEICRFVVRSILRKNIDKEHPELKKPQNLSKKRVKKKTLQQLVIPIFNSNSTVEDRHIAFLQEDELPELRPEVRHRQFLVDVSNIQTCRTIIELTDMVQEPLLNHAEQVSEASTHACSSSNSQVKEDSPMEEDSVNTEQGESDSSENIFEEMSDDEFLSDFEELHNILSNTETSSSGETSGNSSTGQSKEENSKTRKKNKSSYKNKNKSKKGKIDNGKVETKVKTETNSDSDYEDGNGAKKGRISTVRVTTLDTSKGNSEDLENKTDKNMKDPQVQSSQVNLVNYTSCMKEKIKLLPLPMTLKYFLNLNREL